MSGMIVLAGGDEFRQEMVAADREILSRLPSHAKVAIVPAAAAGERPELAAANGVRHFRSLGADAFEVMIVDRASADDEGLVDELMRADLVYMTGGNPLYLRDTLKDSRAWRAMRSMLESGKAVGGSSAGAMVLGEAFRVQGEWHEALGMAPGIAVMPHFEHVGNDGLDDLREVAGARALTLLGVASGSACVLLDGEWRVLGGAPLVVIQGGSVKRLASGYGFQI